MAITLDGTNGVTLPDANSSISSDSGDPLLLKVGGTEMARVDTSGNVGIGTSSPLTNLHVKGTSNGWVTIQRGNDASNVAWLAWMNNTSNANQWGMGLGAAGSNNFNIFNYSTSSNALVIDTSGNLGLGVTPSAWQATSKAYEIGSGGTSQGSWGITASGYMDIFRNAYISGGNAIYKYNGYAQQYRQSADGSHSWGIAASGTAGNAITFTQAMTLDSSGNLLVGTTSPLTNERLNVTSGQGSGVLVLNRTDNIDAASRDMVLFRRAASGVGSITCSNTATAYNTSSDYRLKQDISPMTGALAKVAALKPCIYKWKVDGSDGEGFIAHELQQVVPQCVTGEKDAVDEQGNPKYQGVDTSFLVATLTKAIQEQQALIQTLTARIEALEQA